MGLRSWLRGDDIDTNPTPVSTVEARDSWPALSLDDYMSFFTAGGGPLQTWGSLNDDLGADMNAVDMASLAAQVYRRNGPVAACMFVRLLIFSEARFAWRSLDGATRDLTDTSGLNVLHKPQPGRKTGWLLSRMINHVDLAGNAFVANRGKRLRVMRPDWVTVIWGINDDIAPGDVDNVEDLLDADVVAYAYHPGGRHSGRTPVFLEADEVAHWAPLPDGLTSWRGMSWLTPILREVRSDNLATEHKAQFFKNAASPNLVVKLDLSDPDKFNQWVKLFREEHEGTGNAYKTLFFGAGADTTVVGNSFREMAFRDTIGIGETRIASVAGVPATILGISEGLQGSALNAGNYGQARRRFADGTMRPLWRSACEALENITSPPPDRELWYRDSHIEFLQDDRRDEAGIRKDDAVTLRQLVDAGYKPDTAVDAVTSNDFTRLEHSGRFSVQVQPADEGGDE